MTERLGGLSVNEQSRNQYEKGSQHADARRNLYKYAVPERNLWQEMSSTLKYSKTDQILDVGTGNGDFVEIIQSQIKDQIGSAFQGSILGIDKYPTNYFKTWQRLSHENPLGRVSFTRGDIEDLHFPDSSVDILSSLFVLYHIDNPRQALGTIKRVLKPGGQLLLATRGVQNQYRMWEYGRQVADQIGVSAPKSFYNHFDIDHAKDELEAMFQLEIVPEPQDGHLLIPMDGEVPGDQRGWLDYREALISLVGAMRDKSTEGLISPAQSNQAKEIIDTDIKEAFISEAGELGSDEQQGFFIERVQQTYFVCINNK